MKKIHITEAQLEELRSRISEVVSVDATKDVENKNGNVQPAWADMKAKNPVLGQLQDRGELQLVVNPEGADSLGESKRYTKKQIKEAKLKKLRENSVVFKKSDLK